jgi:hypothetical protein
MFSSRAKTGFGSKSGSQKLKLASTKFLKGGI